MIDAELRALERSGDMPALMAARGQAGLCPSCGETVPCPRSRLNFDRREIPRIKAAVCRIRGHAWPPGPVPESLAKTCYEAARICQRCGARGAFPDGLRGECLA